MPARHVELPLGRPDNLPPTERSPRPESRSKLCSSAARWPRAADALRTHRSAAVAAKGLARRFKGPQASRG
eukprot:4603213-Alexandrium_andersonii.AAC.1